MIFKVGRLFYLSDHSICDYLHLFEKVNMQEGNTLHLQEFACVKETLIG